MQGQYRMHHTQTRLHLLADGRGTWLLFATLKETGIQPESNLYSPSQKHTRHPFSRRQARPGKMAGEDSTEADTNLLLQTRKSSANHLSYRSSQKARTNIYKMIRGEKYITYIIVIGRGSQIPHLLGQWSKSSVVIQAVTMSSDNGSLPRRDTSLTMIVFCQNWMTMPPK